jgi:hypothetical protein
VGSIQRETDAAVVELLDGEGGGLVALGTRSVAELVAVRIVVYVTRGALRDQGRQPGRIMIQFGGQEVVRGVAGATGVRIERVIVRIVFCMARHAL